MSILARHRYIISRVSEAFNYDNEDEVELLIQQDNNLSTINNFFSAEGPTRIIITIDDVEESKPGIGKCPGQVDTIKKLKVFTNVVEKPMKTCVYFSKNKVGRDHDNHVDIDPLKINDNALTFGVMRAPLETMETVMRCVYKPLLENEEMRWGEPSVEKKMEFLGSVDGFIRGLQ